MAFQHSPPTRQTMSPSRKEGRGSRRSNSLSGVVDSFSGISSITVKAPGEDGEEEEEDSVEEEKSDCTEVVPAPVKESQCTGGPAIAQLNQPVSHQYGQS
ncbi:hypothetical protein O181_027722 [Austropuccinia psidii MF-1]|uniref:Uncharacterized protein n=1 Tax=Austropuccinia psidii MF-1 TaxID=1389203 RepID=A0A9Q3H1Y5_9BASI|nr:hypothetical protein [Austropuccinia psidii MF-1]